MNDLPPRVRPLLRARALLYIPLSSIGGVLPDIDHLTFIEQVVGPRGLHAEFCVLGIVCLGVALALLFGLFHKHGLKELEVEESRS